MADNNFNDTLILLSIPFFSIVITLSIYCSCRVYKRLKGIDEVWPVSPGLPAEIRALEEAERNATKTEFRFKFVEFGE